MKIPILFIFLFSVTIVSGQQLADTISLSSNFRGYSFMYHGKKIEKKEVLQIIKNNELAYDEFNSAQEASFFGNVFAIFGGVLIIYPFVNLALGNEPFYEAAFAGACFVGISIPIFRSYNKKTVLAIHKYNSDLANYSKPISYNGLYFGGTSSGIGFKYCF